MISCFGNNSSMSAAIPFAKAPSNSLGVRQLQQSFQTCTVHKHKWSWCEIAAIVFKFFLNKQMNNLDPGNVILQNVTTAFYQKRG